VKTIVVHKAQPSGVPIDDVRLRIEGEIQCPASIADAAVAFDREADLIMDAFQSLPQGTLDALLVRMLEKKRSHFVVAWP